MDNSGRVVQLIPFVGSRIEPVIALEKRCISLSNAQEGSRVDQTNKKLGWGEPPPRHLRRRTNSFRPYHLRHKNTKQKCKPLTEEQKLGQSKRYAKRKKLEYFENQNSRFLSTHLWMSKRMRMSDDFWGSPELKTRLAVSPFEKGERFMLRMAKHGSTCHDLSYYSLINVSGTRLRILDMFRQVLSSQTFELLSKESYFKNGRRFDCDMIYEVNGYPLKPIAPCMFQWCVHTGKLWIWINLLVKDDIVSTFKAAAQDVKFCSKKKQLIINDHSREMLCFRLSGSKSCKTLAKGLSGVLHKEATSQNVLDVWNELICKMRDAQCLPEGISFNIHLSREELKRETSFFPATDSNGKFEHPAKLLKKHFYNVESHRNEGISCKLDDIFAAVKTGKNINSIPCVLIKRAVLSGWDLVLPFLSGLGIHVFKRLIYGGATPSGLYNEHMAMTSIGKSFFPVDYPDCKSGMNYWKSEEKRKTETFLKKPPSKFGIGLSPPDGVSIFAPNWALLLKSGNYRVCEEKSNSLHVIRDSRLFQRHSNMSPDMLSSTLTPLNIESSIGLVSISVSLFHHQPKGVRARLDACSAVYGPTEHDYKCWKQNPRTWNHEKVDISTHSDSQYSGMFLLGFLTSVTASQRVVGCSPVQGLGFARADAVQRLMLEAKQYRRKQTGKKLFVLIRSPKTPNKYICGYLSVNE